ncbi:MAG: TRAP transporter small permease [Sulfitobacter sp.]
MRRILNNFEIYVCALLFAGMTGIGFANVLVRYLTNYSFAATQEFLLAGFLLLTIFGAALSARRGEHLAVTLFSDMMPPKIRATMRNIAAMISLGLLLLTAWYCWELVQNQYRSGVVSSGLQIPAWYYSLGLPLGFVLVALRVIERAIHDYRYPDGAPNPLPETHHV